MEDETRIDQIVGSIVHELRNASTMIGGLSQLLSEDDGRLSAEEIREIARAIGRGSSIIDSVIHRFSDARNLSADGMAIHTEQSDLGELVRAAVAGAPKVGGLPVEVHAAVPVRGSFDPVRIQQVVSILLANARMYGAGPVEVAVSAAGAEARVAVRDHGDGVPLDLQPKLFTRFEKLGRRGGGLGLGLYIARGIARGHGGELLYEDTPGGGATFTLCLPLHGVAG